MNSLSKINNSEASKRFRKDLKTRIVVLFCLCMVLGITLVSLFGAVIDAYFEKDIVRQAYLGIGVLIAGVLVWWSSRVKNNL